MTGEECVLLRPRPAGRLSLPFRVRSVGHRRAGASFSTLDIAQSFFELVWTIGGNGQLVLGDRCLSLPPDSVMILFPGIKRRYHAVEGGWHFRWFTLVGGLTRDILESMNAIPVTVRMAGRCPEPVFSHLESLAQEISADATRECCQLAFQVMLLATNATKRPVRARSALINEAVELIKSRLSDPDLNVNWLAERLNVHRSILSRRFKRENGLAPSEYIIQARLRRAMERLRDGATVADAAQDCGIVNPNYFIRLFHQKTGLTPGAFKQEERI